MCVLMLHLCAGVQRRRMVGPDEPWQKPEIRSNLGHPLSLWDWCEPIHGGTEKSSQLWKEAHCMRIHQLP